MIYIVGGAILRDFNEIYENNVKTVYKFIYANVKDKYLAEEITQETFFRAMKSMHRYNENCKLSVWLCQIAKHVMYQEFDKNSKKKTTIIDDNMDLVDV
ncbi:MAG: RNA polymerase sigma factor, partial [Clostridia bacterium]|nr:RNA polymerase sigma factor [Clostridia bacterium]